MGTTLRKRYTALEFNRDPSAISRSARHFGRVVVTNRGADSLVVMTAEEFRQLEFPAPSPATVLETFALDSALDQEMLGEPPRMRLDLRTDLANQS
ncbi:MAG: type II toxin-antitoxin system prevent-host-death family antitoxin [Bifidobacteriaceae bacterium]|jgi:prevent-host-death family protein|nr:type II toxin-antitoxin system prevent-host-death family antitoxin [Bifidobacteriaceae bacterium]